GCGPVQLVPRQSRGSETRCESSSGNVAAADWRNGRGGSCGGPRGTVGFAWLCCRELCQSCEFRHDASEPATANNRTCRPYDGIAARRDAAETGCGCE